VVRISTNFALRTEIDNYNTIQLPFIKPLALTAHWSVMKLTTTTTVIIIIIIIIINYQIVVLSSCLNSKIHNYKVRTSK
jgi:hypothetical protein